jgi:hypothetical protein
MVKVMRLEPHSCALAAEKTAQTKALWEAIKDGASVDATSSKVVVTLSDGHAFSVVRNGHGDYQAHGKIKPTGYSHVEEKALRNLGERFIKWYRENVGREEKSEKAEHKHEKKEKSEKNSDKSEHKHECKHEKKCEKHHKKK